MSVDLSPDATLARLQAASDLSDLRAELRLHAKLDLSPEGVLRRLREASSLLSLCEALRAPAAPAQSSGANGEIHPADPPSGGRAT